MEGPPRTPPRFVPTLTAVVDLQEEAATAPAPAPASASAPESPAPVAAEPTVEPLSMAPRDAAVKPELPVLTDAFTAEPPFARAPSQPPLAEPGPRVAGAADAMQAEGAPHEGAPFQPVPAPPSMRALPIDEAEAFRLEEELLHRVLQRVDLSLEDRLTEIVSAAVQQQLDAMVPRLRQSVEAALRELVVEAMAHELSETPGSAAHSRTRLDLTGR